MTSHSHVKKACLVFVSVLSSLTVANAFADNHVEVIKSDGSRAQYRLLPVHHDPAHAARVQMRLQSTPLRGPALPAQYEIPRKMLPAVRDQGQRGTCAYFATVGLLENFYMNHSMNFGNTRLSEECLVDVRNWMADHSEYTGDDKPDQRPDPNGDLPNSIIKTIDRYGVPLAKNFNAKAQCVYDGGNERGRDLAVDDYSAIFSQNLSPAFGKGLAFNYDAAPTIEGVKALIAANIPVEVGITVYNEYMREFNWRFDANKDTDDNLAGGHAIQLTGYKVQNGQTIFTFKNSWSPLWGKAGYGTIDEALLTHSWAYDPSFDMTVSVAANASAE